MSKNIIFLLIGTNKYIESAKRSADTIKEFIKIDGFNTQCVLFTNHSITKNTLFDNICKIDHLPWPLVTLLRYHYFIQYQEILYDSDYLFYINADMMVRQNIGAELLSDLVACSHPGYYNRPPDLCPFERNEYSKAYISYGSTAKYYFGSLQGGKTNIWLNASKIMKEWIEDDLKRNYIPIWHDESIYNKYCYLNNPTLVLDPSYCNFQNSNLPFDFKIEKLVKEHNSYRN